MKDNRINTILQVIALLFLAVIGYMTFSSNGNWKLIKTELNKAQSELDISKKTLTTTKSELESAQKDFKKMKAQKDLIIHQRDSLIFSFKKRNAKDWTELQRVKDTIEFINIELIKDRELLDGLFGLNK